MGMIHRYFSDWYKQEMVTALVPNPSPPPPVKQETKWGDGTPVKGLHKPNREDVGDQLAPAGRGEFATTSDAPVALGDYLRNERENIFIKLVTDELQAPANSPTQIKVFGYRLADRGESEQHGEQFGF